MIRVVFASLGMALLIGLIFSPVAIVPAFVILFVLIAATNLGKLKCPHLRQASQTGGKPLPSLWSRRKELCR